MNKKLNSIIRGTHVKPVSTLIIHSVNDVEVKMVSDIKKEDNVWFAVRGYGIYPHITAEQEGFTGKFSDCVWRGKYLDLQELTPSILNDMVKRVYVHAPYHLKSWQFLLIFLFFCVIIGKRKFDWGCLGSVFE